MHIALLIEGFDPRDFEFAPFVATERSQRFGAESSMGSIDASRENLERRMFSRVVTVQSRLSLVPVPFQGGSAAFRFEPSLSAGCAVYF